MTAPCSVNAYGRYRVPPRPEAVTDCDRLFEVEENIAWGEWFLEEALEYSEGDLFLALQVYNCGPERWEANRLCGSYYSRQVMGYLTLIKALRNSASWR